MKIAILHNFLDNIGGAEMVALTLARELDADLYTTNIDDDKIEKMGFKGLRIHSIGRVPTNAPFRQQMTMFRFSRLNLKDKYDFYVIGGDWAASGVMHHTPNLWYIFSPLREVWDLYEYTRSNTVPWYLRWVYDGWAHYNRYLNKKYVNKAQKLVCISKTTNSRIKKYLKKEAQVIYPPIYCKDHSYQGNGDFWLSVNRLITHKRVDMQLEAFRQMPEEKLIIVGSYEKSRHFQRYAHAMKETKPKNVEILSWVDDHQLKDLYARCKGFITTAKDEDYGLTVLEAMASGKPVIAPNEGGYRETVIDGKTGKLIHDITVEKLIEAIKEVNQDPFSYKDDCFARAKEFDTSIFINQFKEILQ